MKKFSKYFSVIFCFTAFFMQSRGQDAIHVSAGTDFFISQGTDIFFDGIILKPSADFLISGPSGITRNTTVAHTFNKVHVSRIYHFGNTTSAYSGDISFLYEDEELNGLPEDNLILHVHDGSTWTAIPQNVTRDAINNSIVTTGISGRMMNELTLATASGPLPVTFKSFKASCINGEVIVSWKTRQEVNSKNFVIERSSGNNIWEKLGVVKAAGNSALERIYSFTDNRPGILNLYRIVQEDYDGRISSSDVVRAGCSVNDFFAVRPNPVRNRLDIILFAIEDGPLLLQLSDAKGAVIKSFRHIIFKGMNQVEINVRPLPKGVYTLKAKWNNEIKTLQIVKD